MARSALPAAGAMLAACAAERPEPPVSETHHCVVIPTGMVECTPREDPRGSGPARPGR